MENKVFLLYFWTMIASVFDALKDCIGAPLCDIKAILNNIAIDFFAPLWTSPVSKDDEPAKERDFTDEEVPAVIMFLMYAYSKDSRMLVFGSDFIEEKLRIADKVQLPEYLHGQCIKLQSECFRLVMLNYLEYQGSRAFRSLQLKKDMFEATETFNFNNLYAQEFDIKMMENNMKIKDRLLEEIKTAEEQLKSEFKFIYDNKEEIIVARDQSRKRGETVDNGNLENSQWINFRRKI